MGTITINVDNEIEMEFREIAKQQMGIGKGKLGQAVEEALHTWITMKKEQEIAQRQLQLMQKGYMLGKYKFDRDGLHERNN